MSPIEHICDHLGRRLRNRNDVKNVNDLERALYEEWAHTPLRVNRRLINDVISPLSMQEVHTRDSDIFFAKIDFDTYLKY